MLKPKIGGPRVLGSARRTFALVASQYNPEFVQGLVDHAAQEFTRIAPGARLSLYQVPGAFEIPVLIQELIMRPDNEIDVVVALGVILQGDTQHADHIARTVTDSLQQIALSTRIPVIHQVLSCKDEAQAKVRCLEDEFNRGIEAARAAVSMANIVAQVRGQ